jgi:hypothetical protein
MFLVESGAEQWLGGIRLRQGYGGTRDAAMFLAQLIRGDVVVAAIWQECGDGASYSSMGSAD